MKLFIQSISALALSSFALCGASIIAPKPLPPFRPFPTPTHSIPSPPKPTPSTHFSTNLTQWTQDHITLFFQTLDEGVFNNTIHCFFDDAVNIQFNGIPTSLDTFIDDVILDKTDAVGAVLDWIDAVEVPANNTNPWEAGSVGLYYNTTVIRNVTGTIINSWVVASINLVYVLQVELLGGFQKGQDIDESLYSSSGGRWKSDTVLLTIHSKQKDEER